MVRTWLKCEHPACGRVREAMFASPEVLEGFRARRFLRQPCPYCRRSSHNVEVPLEAMYEQAAVRARRRTGGGDA